jgi:hypothetical protein
MFCFSTLFDACEPKGDVSSLDFYAKNLEVHTRTGSEGPEGGKGIALLFILGARWGGGGGVKPHSGCLTNVKESL